MQPNKEGRYCMSCQKTVVDFSNMTDKEILDYISNASGNICGRIDTTQLYRGIQENKPRKRFSLLFIWNMIIMLFVFAGKAKAQAVGGLKYEKMYQVKDERPEELRCVLPKTVNGVVKNAITGEPVPFASIMLKGTKIGVSSDSAGKFVMALPLQKHKSTLEVSSLGFETATISFSDTTEAICNLSPEAKDLRKVEVVSYMGMLRGKVRCVATVSRRERIARKMIELLPRKDVVVYPNPIGAGNNIQAALQLKEKGEYFIELMDAGGRIMWMQKINLPETKYNFSIPTQNTWSAGIYWLRISGQHTKKIYNGKIVIQ
jgi:hypothetical protein